MAWRRGVNGANWSRAQHVAPPPPLLLPPAHSRTPRSDPAAGRRPEVGHFLSGFQFLHFMNLGALCKGQKQEKSSFLTCRQFSPHWRWRHDRSLGCLGGRCAPRIPMAEALLFSLRTASHGEFHGSSHTQETIQLPQLVPDETFCGRSGSCWGRWGGSREAGGGHLPRAKGPESSPMSDSRMTSIATQ